MFMHAIWAHFSHISQHKAWLSLWTVSEQTAQGESPLVADIIIGTQLSYPTQAGDL